MKPRPASDVLLRLDAVVEIMFPCGGMTVTGLRKERDRGTLDVVRVAGRDFTTLADVERMIERCRDLQKRPACGSARPSDAPAASPPRHGSFSTAESNIAQASALMRVRKLRDGSKSTSRRSADRPPAASVIPLRSS